MLSLTKVAKPQFSVIIPTLQKSHLLDEVIEQCDKSLLVGEILVVNNAPQPLSFVSPKVRIFNQPQNIFVNPAWNLGASEANYPYLAIINDDVLFTLDAFELSYRALKSGIFGVVGPHKSCFETPHGWPRVRFARPNPTIHGYGTFMCLRKENFVPIPEQLKIWGGDDLLILGQNKPPACIKGVKFKTEMGTTSQSPAFMKLREKEHALEIELRDNLYYSVWWHRPFYFTYHLKNRIEKYGSRFLNIK